MPLAVAAGKQYARQAPIPALGPREDPEIPPDKFISIMETISASSPL